MWVSAQEAKARQIEQTHEGTISDRYLRASSAERRAFNEAVEKKAGKMATHAEVRAAEVVLADRLLPL